LSVTASRYHMGSPIEVAATGKPVILLLMTTQPLDVSWASDQIPAIMDCFFGGTEMGNAVADRYLEMPWFGIETIKKVRVRCLDWG